MAACSSEFTEFCFFSMGDVVALAGAEISSIWRKEYGEILGRFLLKFSRAPETEKIIPPREILLIGPEAEMSCWKELAETCEAGPDPRSKTAIPSCSNPRHKPRHGDCISTTPT